MTVSIKHFDLAIIFKFPTKCSMFISFLSAGRLFHAVKHISSVLAHAQQISHCSSVCGLLLFFQLDQILSLVPVSRSPFLTVSNLAVPARQRTVVCRSDLLQPSEQPRAVLTITQPREGQLIVQLPEPSHTAHHDLA